MQRTCLVSHYRLAYVRLTFIDAHARGHVCACVHACRQVCVRLCIPYARMSVHVHARTCNHMPTRKHPRMRAWGAHSRGTSARRQTRSSWCRTLVRPALPTGRRGFLARAHLPIAHRCGAYLVCKRNGAVERGWRGGWDGEWEEIHACQSVLKRGGGSTRARTCIHYVPATTGVSDAI